MSFRNRPVLDRKHRPRWQDELRTQRLVVAGFAGAIALALGIYGATAWSNHYDAHLSPVAVVDGQTIDADQLSKRIDVMGSELQAIYADLQSLSGGVRDQFIQQQLSALQQQSSTLVADAANSLVVALVLDGAAPNRHLTVSDAQVNAEVTTRETAVERVKLSVITIAALPPDAAAGATPTDADWARAEADAQAILTDLKGGADFATTAKAKSTDASAQGGGLIGWVGGGDIAYTDYFTEAHASAVGTLLGPTKDDTGYHILHVDDHRAAGPNTELLDLLKSSGVSDADYRAYIRDVVLRSTFKDYFSNVIMTTYQPQREIGQIYITADQGVPIPKQRVRHFLAQPLPGQQDQSKATDAQWADALARAQAFRAEAIKPGADWLTLAATSDDPGSKSQGGDLGWYDPASSQFVQDFKNAIARLDVGQVSDPVKTQFGYHIIEITETRTSAADEAAKLVETLRADPNRFAELAKAESEEQSTASKGGEFGWVIPFQLDEPMNSAIFGLTTTNQISDPVSTSSGIWIFKLLDSSPARWVPTDQLAQVRSSGFERWLLRLRDAAHVWVDANYTSSNTAPAAGG